MSGTSTQNDMVESTNMVVDTLARRTTGILSFQNNYRFLSNFWPCKIDWLGYTWPSTEAAYQASKIDGNHPNKDDFIRRMAEAKTPGETKRLGKIVPLRPDWEYVKLDIMYQLNKIKFSEPLLKAKLLATNGAYLEEGNKWHDVYWGVCNGKGENHLGKILMKIREELKNG